MNLGQLSTLELLAWLGRLQRAGADPALRRPLVRELARRQGRMYHCYH